MSQAPKNRILLIIIGILLLTNIVLIATLVLKPTPKKGMRGDRYSMIANFLQNELKFNKIQLQQYDSLNTQHRIKMKSLFDSLKKDREIQFKELSAQHFSDSAINTTAINTSNKQANIERVMLHHLKEIRELCTPQQLPKFDSLFYKAFNKKNEDQKK